MVVEGLRIGVCVFGLAGGAQSDCLSVCISILSSFSLCFSHRPITALLVQTDKLQLSCLCSLHPRRHFVYECNFRFITWPSLRICNFISTSQLKTKNCNYPRVISHFSFSNKIVVRFRFFLYTTYHSFIPSNISFVRPDREAISKL